MLPQKYQFRSFCQKAISRFSKFGQTSVRHSGDFEELFVEPLEERQLLSAAAQVLLDINTEASESDPQGFVESNGIAYFTADTPEFGRELWRSDGTEAGTRLVKDITEGPSPSTILSFADADGTLIFRVGTREIWRSDGTESGTELLLTSDASIESLTSFDGTVYFSPFFFGEGRELWKTDGTESGTQLVKDIFEGSASSSPDDFSILDSQLFFTATNETGGRQIWSTNGKESGTQPVETRPANFTDISQLAAIGDRLYFQANRDEFWTTDLTSEGTRLLASGFSIAEIIDVDGVAAISARATLDETDFGPASLGIELWASDGTVSGTRLVKDIITGESSSNPRSLVAFDGSLFFRADDGRHGIELWTSDLTADGTTMLKDIGFGIFSSFPEELTVLEDGIIFSASSREGGRELWRTDGTFDGTEELYAIAEGPSSSEPNELFKIGGEIFLNADNGIVGRELWKTDGTAIGTELVRDIDFGTLDSVPSLLTQVGNTLYFRASSSTGLGSDLWMSDGTSAGTKIIRDINNRVELEDVSLLTASGSKLFFVANDQLWVTEEGEEGATVIQPDEDLRPSQLVDLNGSVYFSSGGKEALYRSDGTDEGTYQVSPFTGSFRPFSITNAGGSLFMREGSDLWISGDPIFGTFLLKEGINPSQFVESNGTVYFSGRDAENGGELWKTDGTVDGTVMVKDIFPGPTGSLARNFVPFGDGILFQASGENGFELFVSDGTSAGTYELRDINPGTSSSSIRNLTRVNDSTVVFSATDGTGGHELWRTDGTSSGTELVMDIRPGEVGSDPGEFFVDAGTAYFSANDGVHGGEIWRTGGDKSTTALVDDVTKGAGGSQLFITAGIIEVNNRIFFRGTTLDSGNELLVAERTIYGTSDNDEFIVKVNESTIEVSVNGVSSVVPKNSDSAIKLHGLGGDDSIVIYGSDSDESAILRAGSFVFSSENFVIEGMSFEDIHVVGNGGDDEVLFGGSPDDDRLVAQTQSSLMFGEGFRNRATGFGSVTVNGANGRDSANVYDTAGDDQFIGNFRMTKMTGTNYSVKTHGIEQVTARSLSGTDIASFTGSVEDDAFLARPAFSLLRNIVDGNVLRANQFSEVSADGNGGYDVASVYDSEGDDTFVAKEEISFLQGDGFKNIARDFDRVASFANFGGDDTAILFDSAGDDQLLGQGNSAILTGENGSFINFATNFETVRGNASEGGIDALDIRPNIQYEFVEVGEWEN